MRKLMLLTVLAFTSIGYSDCVGPLCNAMRDMFADFDIVDKAVKASLARTPHTNIATNAVKKAAAAFVDDCKAAVRNEPAYLTSDDPLPRPNPGQPTLSREQLKADWDAKMKKLLELAEKLSAEVEANKPTEASVSAKALGDLRKAGHQQFKH